MFDPQKLLEQFLGGGKSATGNQAERRTGGLSPDFIKGLATGGAAGGLAGILLGGKSSKKMAKGAVKLGGTAALAGLAYKAYEAWRASQQAPASSDAPPPPMKDITPQPEGTPFLPGPRAERDTMSLAILRAMIAAAKADGHIDGEEHRRIFEKLGEIDLGTEEKAFIIDELRKPLDIDSIVKAATTPELALEIYAASFLAIEPDDPAEQAYLAMLASRLKLDPSLKAAVEAEASKVVA